ncbi:MAG: vacuolar transporter chaperone [Vezdaea aestivalis]|nr:MAG: vacuolar transporter chaperone [Vezdaea aestivalis]
MSSQPLLQSAPGKRIALPTRVEPKVFFANERTFLSWLNFSVIIGGLAIGLLNFGDRVGRISAALFTLVAMASMIYALFTFHWRARSIRQRGQAGFDDRYGTTVLTVAMLAAIVVNFGLRFSSIGEEGSGKKGL